MAIENPLEDPTTTKNLVLHYCDIVITSMFACEVIIKIIAKGFILNGETSYLRSSWDILDFTIVIFSVLSLASNNGKLKIFKVLRLIRVMRPLRVISRNEGLKLAV